MDAKKIGELRVTPEELAEGGCALPEPKRKRDRDMRALAKIGCTPSVIAEAVGAAQPWVSHWLRRGGVHLWMSTEDYADYVRWCKRTGRWPSLPRHGRPGSRFMREKIAGEKGGRNHGG